MKQIHTRWTAEQDQWLRENIDIYSFVNMPEAFNIRFSMNRTYDSIVTRCMKVLKLKRNKNTGLFKTGETKMKTYKLGDEVFRNGYWYVKTDEKKFEGKVDYKDFSQNWTVKQRYIYEKTYGKIPDEKIVVFLDMNKENFDISNLYAIDRKINAVMNKNRWFTENRTLTLTAIKWCELYYAIHD